jgi:hypothetical protein
MTPLMRYLAGTFVSSFVAASAAAAGPESGNALVAPQLALTAEGPISATFVGASQPFGQLAVTTESGLTGFFFGFTSPAAGQQFQTTLTTGPGAILPPGTDVTFAATFFDASGTRTWSTTGASSFVATNLAAPSAGVPPSLVLQNAAVIQTAPGRVLIGFNPSGSSASGLGGFAVRIAVSNVCVR